MAGVCKLRTWLPLPAIESPEQIYERPPLFRAENIAALEEAAAQWRGDEAQAIQDSATHYRRKLDRRVWR